VPVIHIDGDDDNDDVSEVVAAEAESPQLVAMDDTPVSCHLKLF